MPTLLFDFTDPAAVLGWHAIDDRVMGGISRSRLRHDPAGHAVFEGEVSLAQGGGFASVRSPAGDFGRPGVTACTVEVRSAGMQAFKLSLFTDDRFDGVSHQAGFAPPGSGWQVLTLPLASFRARFRGREVPGAGPLDPARIRQLGLMVAGRQAGPFALEIRSIGLAWGARLPLPPGAGGGLRPGRKWGA
jgi:hypothetical protein